MIEIVVPKISANEDIVNVVDIKIKNNQFCKKDEVVFVLESTKATMDIEIEKDGYVYSIAEVGDEVVTGQTLGYIGFEPVDIKKLKKRKMLKKFLI